MVPADGNCWFWSNTDLIKVYGLPAPHDPNELRKAVANSLLTSKHKMNWLQNVFQRKMRKMKKFIKEQSQPGQFIDNNGIMVILTSDYLGVQYHIAGTSNNAQNPVTKLGDATYESFPHWSLSRYYWPAWTVRKKWTLSKPGASAWKGSSLLWCWFWSWLSPFQLTRTLV